jgi:hypothetical protein
MNYRTIVTISYNLGFDLSNEVIAKITWSVDNEAWSASPDTWAELDTEHRDQLVRLLMWIND